MKKLMPLIAAGAILLGSACSTYTSSTDPCDLCSGWITPGNNMAAGHTASPTVAEANNNATFDNKTIKANRDSSVIVAPDSVVQPATAPPAGN